MKHKSCLCVFVLLLVSTSIRGDFAWLEDDPTSNIPTLTDEIEIDDYLEDSKFLFDNLEGGAWRQGWDIKYDDEKWTEEPLNVFVCMHSHNDPGWQKTFEDYFQQQTKGIINTIVNTLDKDPAKRFIWAEISFFSRWWETVDQSMKDKAKRVIANKQLEIVTGGWVMNDEATVHYLATINQLMMGHIWLEQNVGVVPTTGWAIDPFGHSPTMASILNQAGFKAMIINRVHYYVKKVLAWNKSLEFRWRQQWDTDASNNEMIAHMFPFFSYDMAHTCGPSPKVCSQFEFVNSRTLWGDNVEPITESNIDAKAKMIVDQYKKKAALFKTGNNVLIPLGDDFKYFDQNYMDTMTKNFDPLFKYINDNRAKFKVNVRFATLNEYFDAVAKSAEKVMHKGAESHDYKEFFPVIKGDFFTYDDVREDYWSGYFTSRPFWKNLDRQMEPSMRSAEMLLAWTRGLIPNAKREEFDRQGHFGKLLEGRKLWGIFQHHDGMTGTARKHVVVDYGHMLHTALWNANTVMQDVLPTLLSKPGASQTVSLHVNDEQAQSSDVVHAKLLDLVESEEIALVLYNSLTRARTEILSIHVNTPKIEIVNAEGEAVDFQISPVVRLSDLTMETAQYKIYFRAELAPATVSTLFVRRTSTVKASAVPQITVLRTQWPSTFLDKNIADSVSDEIRLSNAFFDVNFDKSSGLMTSINVRNLNFRSEFKEDYAAYEANGGAYLFLPKGPANSFAGTNHPIIIIQGSLVSETMTKLPEIVSRAVRLFHIDEYEDNTRYIEVENYVDLKKENREVVNRYTVPSVKNEKKFFTDLNGFSFRQRYIRNDKPIGFNFYPITETAFMQDNSFRFSVHTQQPLGVGALNTGELELVLDRRLAQDDSRGLAEPVQDNLPMLVKFQLTFEKTPRPASDVDERAVARSLYGLDRALKFNNPVTIFSGVATRNQWQQSFITEKSMLSPSSALVVRNDFHLTAFKLRDPHDSDPKRRDETIVQVMRYLYDIKDGDGANVAPFSMDLSREFDLFTLANSRRRSITTVLDDPNDEEGVSIQRVATWLTDVVPSSDQVIVRPISKVPKPKPAPMSQNNTPIKSRAPKPSAGTNDNDVPVDLANDHARSEHNFYVRFALLVFIGSSALVVYVTWANRRTAVRWFAMIILLSNLINVLIIGYLLNDL